MPSGKRIGSLKTISDVSVEYRRVYRLARNEKLDIQTARSLAWMLKTLSGMLVESDLEKRLEELEARL